MSMTDFIAIGKKIKQLRQQLGLTQGQLAEKINVSYQQIQKYEKGESELSLSRFLEIAAVLNISPHSLLDSLTGLEIAEPKSSYVPGQSESLKVTPREKKFILAFRKIKNTQVQDGIYKLLRSLANED
jgi:transcriptional regulator with XRE-family HTH domain